MQTRNTLQATGLGSRNVHIGSDHGYTFDGDSVHLEAELVVDTLDGATGQEWALQLWACDSPFDGQPITGSKIAEAPLEAFHYAGLNRVSAVAAAFPPAGRGQHNMVMVLASGRQGSFEQIEDYTNFSLPASFVQPRLAGSTGFTLFDTRVNVMVEGIENPRGADNLSGSLSLELWALNAPYTSGNPDGVQLAVAQLGCLGGEQSWPALNLDLSLLARPVGTWHIALLLREWTPAGFVTRDASNFALPVSWAAEAEVEAAPVVEAQAAVEATPAVEEAAVKPAAKAKPAKAAAPKAKAPAAKAAEPKAAAPAGVSINTASESELAAVKGLPKAVAAAIVAARPFKSIDELVKVKGMGVKMLDKLKGSLSL